MTHHLEHSGDIDLEPNSESLNLLKGETRQHDASYFPQLMHWYIKITEYKINTVILIFSFHGNHKLTKVYLAKCILSINSPKFATTKVSLYTVHYC